MNAEGLELATTEELLDEIKRRSTAMICLIIKPQTGMETERYSFTNKGRAHEVIGLVELLRTKHHNDFVDLLYPDES